MPAWPPESAIPRDTLLANLSIYWFTRTINSANRLYYESRCEPITPPAGQRIEVPCGFLLEHSPTDRTTPLDQATTRAGAAPRENAEGLFNIHRWVEAPKGGHFPAIETPELLVSDLRDFFRPLRA